jgi:hypothetical protein
MGVETVQDAAKAFFTAFEGDAAKEFANVVRLAKNNGPNMDHGYRVATDNEVWPPVIGTTVEAAPDREGPAALRYRTADGRDVVVKGSINPKLHEFLTRLRELNKSPETLNFIDLQRRLHGSEVMHREGDLPALADVRTVDRQGDAVMIGTKDGKYITVTRQLSPEAFERAASMDETFKGIKASEAEGYQLVNDNPFTDKDIDGATIGPEGEVGPGLVRAEVFDGNGGSRKVIVSEELNPELYGRFVSTDESRRYDTKTIDDSRSGAGLPNASSLDISGMATAETDPNDSSRKLTVGELTWQTLIADWKTGIENGTISKDDDRAKLYNALRAKAATEHGLDMVVLDISLGQSTAKVTGKDIAAIVDPVKLDKRIAELFGSESVQNDFRKHQKAALEKLPDKDRIFAELEKTAFSEDYVRYIAGLKTSGQEGLAEADIAKTYASLAAFDPDKAAKFAQSVMLDATLMDLDSLIANPEGINEDNTVLATQDVTKTILAAIKKGGIDLPRRTVESIDKFVNEFLNDKQTAKAFNAALQELGDKFIKNGNITQADIDELLRNGTFQALNERTGGGFLSTIATMNNFGALGSAGGLVSLASGIYQIAGKGGALADTPEERLAIAKEMIGFLGAGQHFVNLGSNIYDKINGTKVNAMLGLDKVLPQIFGADKGSGSPFTTDLGRKFVENLEEVIDKAPVDDAKRLSQRLDLTEDQTRMIVKGMEEGFARNPGLPGSTKFTRGVSAFLRVMDAGANTFAGIADTVLGGLMIKKGVQNGDGAQIAQGAVQVAAGAFTFAGGGAAAAALAGSTVARALAGPLLWAGALLSVALTPFMIVEDIKHNNRMDGHRDDVKDLFKELGEDGLLVSDGAKRFEFLDGYMYGYGQRDAPGDVSIFEYRAEEYAFFLREGHFPSPGFDDLTHDDYGGDGDNLDTIMDRGSTVGS